MTATDFQCVQSERQDQTDRGRIAQDVLRRKAQTFDDLRDRCVALLQQVPRGSSEPWVLCHRETTRCQLV